MTLEAEEWIFGGGSLIVLAVFIIIMFVAIKVNKYTAALMLPLGILLGLEYFAHDLGWHGLISIFASIIVALIAAVGDKT